VNCVNKAIAALKANGTLQRLQQKYLQIYLTFPTIQP
jgi:ABC-type amino acid transport substrate-binding protein